MKPLPNRISEADLHLIADFLDDDASFWARHPDLIETTCGGNAFWWEFQGADVLLTFQHGPRDRQGNVKDPGVLISREFLWSEIKKRYRVKVQE